MAPMPLRLSVIINKYRVNVLIQNVQSKRAVEKLSTLPRRDYQEMF